MSEVEEEALFSAGADPLFWRLALNDRLPFNGVSDILSAPAPILWQAEILADSFARVDRRAKIEHAIGAAFKRSKRGNNNG